MGAVGNPSSTETVRLRTGIAKARTREFAQSKLLRTRQSSRRTFQRFLERRIIEKRRQASYIGKSASSPDCRRAARVVSIR